MKRQNQDEIPEAVRVGLPSEHHQLTRLAPKKSRQRVWLILVVGLTLGIVAVVMGHLIWNPTSPKPIPVAESHLIRGDTTPHVVRLMGHLAYQEAPRNALVALSTDGKILLRRAAAKSFRDLQVSAQTQGISLVPISGFRTISDQQYLFFGIAAQREQTPAQRAEVSAPPGYSEHHTGYAIDLGDEAMPETHLEVGFEQTRAFQWLQANAQKFHFELSFPKHNHQGVHYEPWHWRFVGDAESLSIFAKARQLFPVNGY